MPWTNEGGSGRGPWGQGPSGGGMQPPNLEELLKRGQDRFKGMLPGGVGWGGRGIAVLVLLAVVGWLFSGFYRVEPDEVGVEQRFGRYSETSLPGLRYHLPFPIEMVTTPKVTRVNRVDVGFRSAAERGRAVQATGRDITEESLMLTGDENIVDIDFAVFWRINDARAYLFNVQQPAPTVKAVAESVMREVVGKRRIDDVLTEGREDVQRETRESMQRVLDSYGAGIDVTQVQLQKADPPAAVIDAFRDVQAARADQERLRNEAQAYSNDVIPRARGQAEQVRLEAEGYREQVVADAQGEVSRFLAIYGEYAQARTVVRERMYLETMEQVFQGINKIVIGTGDGQGVMPFLPLTELLKRQQPAPAVNRSEGHQPEGPK
ncbi:MAG: FtsH protease activity modulator HflK [Alphaproteobacteria bacterium]|nr:FtsH protease activity modulator HflK [Alphaproteobacteria bacterium]